MATIDEPPSSSVPKCGVDAFNRIGFATDYSIARKTQRGGLFALQCFFALLMAPNRYFYKALQTFLAQAEATPANRLTPRKSEEGPLRDVDSSDRAQMTMVRLELD